MASLTSTSQSVELAGLIGPTLLVVAATEAAHLDVFAEAARAGAGVLFAPHVYLNGLLLFVAGLAVVRAHNRWTPAWPVLITAVGWAMLLGGVSRMAVPTASPTGDDASETVARATLAVLAAVGVVLTYKAYGP